MILGPVCNLHAFHWHPIPFFSVHSFLATSFPAFSRYSGCASVHLSIVMMLNSNSFPTVYFLYALILSVLCSMLSSFCTLFSVLCSVYSVLWTLLVVPLHKNSSLRVLYLLYTIDPLLCTVYPLKLARCTSSQIIRYSIHYPLIFSLCYCTCVFCFSVQLIDR